MRIKTLNKIGSRIFSQKSTLFSTCLNLHTQYKFQKYNCSYKFKHTVSIAVKHSTQHHVFDPISIDAEGNLKPDVHRMWKKAPLGLSIFQPLREIQNSEKKRHDIMRSYQNYKNNHKPENRKKLTGSAVFPEPKATHNFCQVCRCSIADYFTHVGSFEHKNAWSSSKNKDSYDVLDNLISEISQAHIKEIREKEFIVEEKENKEMSEEFMMSYSNSRATNTKSNNMRNIDDISTFPTSSDIVATLKPAYKQGRRVLKRIENTMNSANVDKMLSQGLSNPNKMRHNLKPNEAIRNRLQCQNEEEKTSSISKYSNIKQI